MSADLVSAAKALLETSFAAMPPTDRPKVYDTRVTDVTPPTRYVILTGGTGRQESETFDGGTEQPNVRLRATIVALLPVNSAGTPGPMARWLAAKVDSVLIGARPSIDDRITSRIRHIATDFQGSDEQITDRLSAYYVGDYAVSVT